MPVCRRKTFLRGRVGRLIGPIVIAHLIGGHEDRTHENRCRTCHKDRLGPTHHTGPDTSVQMRFGLLLGIEEPEQAAQMQHGRPEGKRCCDGQEHADGHRRAHRVEVVETREAQA